MYPWAGLFALITLAGIAAAAWWWPPRRWPAQGALRVGGLDRLRRLPRFQHLVAHRRRWSRTEVISLALASVGVALVAARPVAVDTLPEQSSNRDVVLCLDVSGSMAPVVTNVMHAFSQLADSLRGERISLVWFDGAAITMFPLTDDATYIATELQSLTDELGGAAIDGTQVAEVGTSLVGDGLASCLQRFDQPQQSRSRTVVLATDNQVSGKPLLSLSEAIARAVEQNVLVYGITPSDNSVAATDALTEQVETTGGSVMLLGPQAPLHEITDAVAATQSARFSGPARAQPQALLWPALIPIGLGLSLACYSGIRRRRP